MADSIPDATVPSHSWKITDLLMRLVTPSVRERLYALSLSITRDDGVSDLIVSDSISKCAERVDPAKVQPEKLVAYLKVMVRNKSFDWFRNTKAQRLYFRLHHDLSSRSALSEATSREALEMLEKEIAKLPEYFQKVVTLRVIDQLTFSEIAKKLNISQGTVLSRFFRAKQLLWRWVNYAKAE